MTSRERLLCALRGGQPDRVAMPLRMWKFLRKYYPGVGHIEATLRSQDEFGLDIFYPTCSPMLPCFQPIGTPWRDDIAVDVRHEVRGNRNWWERTIHTPEGDLHDIKQALVVDDGSGDGPEIVEPLIKDLKRDLPLMRYMQMDSTRMDVAGAHRTDEIIGDRGITLASMYSAIDCRDMLRPADFLMLYHDDRGAFREIVEIGAKAMMEETRAVLKGGLRIVKTWWFYASPSAGWSPRIYEEMFLPHVVRHVELVHDYGGLYIYYDDGKMGRFLDMYVDAGIDCLMTLTPPPMGDAIPAEVKATYGDRISLMGGIDAVNEVYLSTPERIRAMVQARLATYMPGGGYIMDGSNSIVYETAPDNVRALADAGREFGEY